MKHAWFGYASLWNHWRASEGDARQNTLAFRNAS